MILQTNAGKVYKFLVHNDQHHFGAHALKELKPYGFKIPNNRLECYIGDNYDLSGCKKKDIIPCQEAIERALEYYKTVEGVFVLGNHELNHAVPQSHWVVVVGEIMFTHGDLGPLWHWDKGTKYRAKKPGAGFLKRNVGVPLINFYRKYFKRYEIKDKAMSRAVQLAKTYRVKYIVCGHGHPKNEIRRTQEGITLIVLPRGTNELDIVI